MEFLRNLWTLLVNAWLGRELEEKDPYVMMEDFPVVMIPYERVEPTIAPATYILEDLPADPIPEDPVNDVIGKDHMLEFRTISPNP